MLNPNLAAAGAPQGPPPGPPSGMPPQPGPQGQPPQAGPPQPEPQQTFKAPPVPPRDPDDDKPLGAMTPFLPSALKDPDDRKRYAMKLQRWAQSWIDHISPLTPRWETNERLVINQPEMPKELPWDGAVWTHIPVSSSKGNAWKSFVCQPPMSSSPYGVSTIFGKDATRAKTVEMDLYQFMLRGEFARYYCRNTWATGLYGKSIWRVYFDYDEEDFPIIRFEDIAPRRWIMYPNVTEIRKTRMHGHLYEVSLRDIVEMQDTGQMFEEPVITGEKALKDRPPVGVVDNQTTTGMPDQGPKEDDDDDSELMVRCGEVFVRERWGATDKHSEDGEHVHDGKDKWYLVRFAMDQAELLGIYEYPYSVTWYFDEFVHEEPEKFWPETSRINDLQSLQHATNAIFNQTLWGMQMAWDPATFTPGWALDKKYNKLKPGTMVPIAPGGGAISQTNSQVNVGASEVLMDNVDKRSDRVMRFSDQQLGAQVSGDTTATEADIKQKSSNVASADDMANISLCIGKVMKFCQELFRKHYAEFFDAYGEDLATQPDSSTYAKGFPLILGRPMQWELLGKTPDQAPTGQTHAMMALIQSLSVFANPQLLASLQALGINLEEFVHSLIRNSNLNDRDIILMSQDGKAGGGVDQLIQKFHESQAAAQSKGPNPQVEQAKIQIEQQKTQSADKKMQIESHLKELAEKVKLYGHGHADIDRQVEEALGMKPSTVHPVTAKALESGAIHQNLLAPALPPTTNGKSKPSVMK